MPTSVCLIIGAGGHAKVVVDAWQRANPGAVAEIRDDDPDKAGTTMLGTAVATPIGQAGALRRECHVAIGDNAARRRIAELIAQAGGTLVQIRHPDAKVSAHALIEPGAFVAALAIVAADARVGRAAIVNHGAIVDHDCRVGAWTHIAPRAVLGGKVRIGEGCLIGSGAVVLPGLSIGDGSIVGAGAVVCRDVPAGATVIGVPARKR